MLQYRLKNILYNIGDHVVLLGQIVLSVTLLASYQRPLILSPRSRVGGWRGGGGGGVRWGLRNEVTE